MLLHAALRSGRRAFMGRWHVFALLKSFLQMANQLVDQLVWGCEQEFTGARRTAVESIFKLLSQFFNFSFQHWTNASV